jgi:hypothetical protein
MTEHDPRPDRSTPGGDWASSPSWEQPPDSSGSAKALWELESAPPSPPEAVSTSSMARIAVAVGSAILLFGAVVALLASTPRKSDEEVDASLARSQILTQFYVCALEAREAHGPMDGTASVLVTIAPRGQVTHASFQWMDVNRGSVRQLEEFESCCIERILNLVVEPPNPTRSVAIKIDFSL